MVSDRREHRRIRGSAIPWLSAWTALSVDVRILNISDGGMLLEMRKRVRPGAREVVLLKGTATLKVIGWAERVEIIRLLPCVSYRTALRFAKPIMIRALGKAEFARLINACGLLDRDPVEHPAGTMATTFESLVCGLPSVQAATVSAAVMRMPETEAIHFPVPASSHGDKRMLQVFFASGTLPTAEEFAQLRQLAELASTLPDVRIARSQISRSVP